MLHSPRSSRNLPRKFLFSVISDSFLKNEFFSVHACEVPQSTVINNHIILHFMFHVRNIWKIVIFTFFIWLKHDLCLGFSVHLSLLASIFEWPNWKHIISFVTLFGFNLVGAYTWRCAVEICFINKYEKKNHFFYFTQTTISTKVWKKRSVFQNVT